MKSIEKAKNRQEKYYIIDAKGKKKKLSIQNQNNSIKP